MTAVAEIVVAGAADPWERIGLHIVDRVAAIGGIRLRFVDPPEGELDSEPGNAHVISWTLAGSPNRPGLIDGLISHYIDDIDEFGPSDGTAHPLGVTGFDHLVVMTSSLERTCAAIEAVTGEPLKRVRDAGAVQQGFHRLGPLIVEVAESLQTTSTAASFWGFVWVVDDLYEVAARLGPDVLTMPRQAIQRGRLISTVRGSAGLGIPVALMTPHQR